MLETGYVLILGSPISIYLTLVVSAPFFPILDSKEGGLLCIVFLTSFSFTVCSFSFISPVEVVGRSTIDPRSESNGPRGFSLADVILTY